jgi:hypothetical protein
MTAVLTPVVAIGGTLLVLLLVYLVFRRYQRSGETLHFVNPRLPESMQGRPPEPLEFPPGRPYPHDDTSLADDEPDGRPGTI